MKLKSIIYLFGYQNVLLQIKGIKKGIMISADKAAEECGEFEVEGIRIAPVLDDLGIPTHIPPARIITIDLKVGE